eukprot:scaffold1642_cov252-Pinguiococcus_pyrenoidosus.AAC.29
MCILRSVLVCVLARRLVAPHDVFQRHGLVHAGAKIQRRLAVVNRHGVDVELTELAEHVAEVAIRRDQAHSQGRLRIVHPVLHHEEHHIDDDLLADGLLPLARRADHVRPTGTVDLAPLSLSRLALVQRVVVDIGFHDVTQSARVVHDVSADHGRIHAVRRAHGLIVPEGANFRSCHCVKDLDAARTAQERQSR